MLWTWVSSNRKAEGYLLLPESVIRCPNGSISCELVHHNHGTMREDCFASGRFDIDSVCLNYRCRPLILSPQVS